jgi:hypothetical protein
LSVPQLWVPGAAGPSLEDFVKRLHTEIESFKERRGWEQASVEVELVDGTRWGLHSIRPDPGYGFITLCPFPEDEERPWPRTGQDQNGECPPEEVIVPVGSIKRITLGEPEPRRARFGFSGAEPEA